MSEIGKHINHSLTEVHIGCEPLRGYPTFQQILENADAWKMVLMGLDILLVAVTLCMFITEAKFMHKYLRRRKVDRHQRKMIYFEAGVPFVLGFSALVVNFAPRTNHIVRAFSAVYFVICINGFARMIFDYEGGISGTAEKLQQEGQMVSYRAVPLTCCCFCVKDQVASNTNLVRLRVGVLQAVWITTFCTFLSPAILFDGSVCTHGKMPTGVVTSPFMIITIIDLISTMIAVTSLTAIANCTQAHLTKYRVKAKFVVFKLSLIFYRIQPSILQVIQQLTEDKGKAEANYLEPNGAIGKLKPLRPRYSNAAFLATFNAQLQIMEFFLLSLAMRMILESAKDAQMAEERTLLQRVARSSRSLLRSISATSPTRATTRDDVFT